MSGLLHLLICFEVEIVQYVVANEDMQKWQKPKGGIGKKNAKNRTNKDESTPGNGGALSVLSISFRAILLLFLCI